MTPPPLLLGHRGARVFRSVAENTPASFDLALDHGCNGFEFDVRLTACGRAVICHDERVKRISIAKAGYTRLKHLPQLQDILTGFASRAFLDIELKVRGLESLVLDALRAYPPQRGYVVSSFLPEVLRDLRLRSAVVQLGFICDRKKQLDLWRELPVEYVILHRSLITRPLVDEVHKTKKFLFAWTVNDKVSMLRLAGWDVDGIISDRTRLLATTLH
jgi:glycerophosphoryl diester phosphodiesterase